MCLLKEAGAIDAACPYLERLVGFGVRLTPHAVDAILAQAGEER